MIKRGHRLWIAGMAVILPVGLFVAAGCSKPEESAPPPGPPAGAPGGGPGGAGGFPDKMGGGKMGGGPLAENATGAEIYQAKCNCHGPGGKTGRAPNLTGTSSRSDDELFKIVHGGKGKMPSFSSQLSDDQIKKVVAEIKGFKP